MKLSPYFSITFALSMCSSEARIGGSEGATDRNLQEDVSRANDRVLADGVLPIGAADRGLQQDEFPSGATDRDLQEGPFPTDNAVFRNVVNDKLLFNFDDIGDVNAFTEPTLNSALWIFRNGARLFPTNVDDFNCKYYNACFENDEISTSPIWTVEPKDCPPNPIYPDEPCYVIRVGQAMLYTGRGSWAGGIGSGIGVVDQNDIHFFTFQIIRADDCGPDDNGAPCYIIENAQSGRRLYAQTDGVFGATPDHRDEVNQDQKWWLDMGLMPSSQPTMAPTLPSSPPTMAPTSSPTKSPTLPPTPFPTTSRPTNAPTPHPTIPPDCQVPGFEYHPNEDSPGQDLYRVNSNIWFDPQAIGAECRSRRCECVGFNQLGWLKRGILPERHRNYNRNNREGNCPGLWKPQWCYAARSYAGGPIDGTCAYQRNHGNTSNQCYEGIRRVLEERRSNQMLLRQ